MRPRLPRSLRIAAICALLLPHASGCGGGGPSADVAPGAGKSSSERPRIALIMKSLANEFFKTMADGAQADQKANADKYDLIVNGIKDERDLSRQVGLIDEMIAQGVQAIVIAPADSRAVVPALKRALDAGIVVVNIDNKLDDAVLKEQDVVIPFVGPDNRAGAELIGEHLGGILKAGDPVAIVEGIPTAFNGQQRRLGFENSARKFDWKILDTQSGQWEMEPANRIASAMLTAHPDLKALLCCNDSMALGALAAVKAAGKSGEILIVGYDGITAVRDAIREGAIEATVEQHADQLAIFGIDYALQLLNDPDSRPADKTTDIELVTAESLAPAGGAP